VWQRLFNGDAASPEQISSPLDERTFPVFRVPAEALASAPAHPRLRRSSAISRFAAAAGLAALQDAGVTLTPEIAERTAIVFAVSNGGVIYTKRFYHEVVETGAQAASPLLFPETVFNAPASHLAAILGIAGASYTLVGDGAVGLLAIKMAEDLMENPAIDRCLIVAAEETDWLLCDAYHRWRLLRTTPPIEPFRRAPRGMILAEGAGAVLLDRVDGAVLEQTDAGCNFEHQRDAAKCVDQVFAKLRVTNDDLVIASANGTFVDSAEAAAIQHHAPEALVLAPKAALGESVGASTLWQLICGVHALRTQDFPQSIQRIDALPSGDKASVRANQRRRRAIVSACGMNQQVAGLAVALNL
jgi:3-oxoacyl-(acyl-carrier-protein) synthase